MNKQLLIIHFLNLLYIIHQKEIERANSEKQKRLEEKEKERQLIKEKQKGKINGTTKAKTGI